MKRLLEDDRLRRVLWALAVYAVVTAVYFACASRALLLTHTPWNHFALLADGWLQGRLDLGGPPPAYAGNNDFAEYHGKWFVTFPPFPAVLLIPVVKLAHGASRVQDGQFFLWLSGIGPAVLFLGLEKLGRAGFSTLSRRANLLLALLFAFGTVYFFTAEQGTVWFAAHVVGVALAAAYLLVSIGAEHPLGAGLLLGLGYLTRTPLLFSFPLFALEAIRVCLRPGSPAPAAVPSAQLELPLGGVQVSPPASAWQRLDKGRLVKLYVLFAVPIALVFALSLWHNWLRFGDPFEVGYRYLTVAWRARMEKWGLFHYHYLARNLGVILTGLPFWPEPGQRGSFQINTHGLALWFTTPAYLWLLWPRRVSLTSWALGLTALAVALPSLVYQNTGWLQFGYRFSNDYAVFLFALLAVGGYRLGRLFLAAGIWALAVNLFGALTFGRSGFEHFYYQDASQRTFYQPD